jgi:glutamine synthetase
LDFYQLGPEEAAKIQSAPGSLDAALQALQNDHEFLTKGGVFTPDFLETYLELKIRDEIDPVRLRPHPHEFFLYYDI